MRPDTLTTTFELTLTWCGCDLFKWETWKVTQTMRNT